MSGLEEEMLRIIIYLNLLTDCGEDRRGVVEGARELPRHARLVGLLHEHQLLQQDEVHAIYVVLRQELSLER